MPRRELAEPDSSFESGLRILDCIGRLPQIAGIGFLDGIVRVGAPLNPNRSNKTH